MSRAESRSLTGSSPAHDQPGQGFFLFCFWPSAFAWYHRHKIWLPEAQKYITYSSYGSQTAEHFGEIQLPVLFGESKLNNTSQGKMLEVLRRLQVPCKIDRLIKDFYANSKYKIVSGDKESS